MKVGAMEFSITRRILLQRIDLLLLACLHLAVSLFLSWWLLRGEFTQISSSRAGGWW